MEENIAVLPMRIGRTYHGRMGAMLYIYTGRCSPSLFLLLELSSLLGNNLKISIAKNGNGKSINEGVDESCERRNNKRRNKEGDSYTLYE